MSSLTSRRVRMGLGVGMASLGVPIVMLGLGVGDWIQTFRNRGHVGFVLAGITLTLLGALIFASGWWTSESGKRSQFFIPPEGRVYLLIMTILFCGSQIGSSNMLLMVFVAMAGPWVINGWMTYMMLRRLSLTRFHPERVMAGETFSVQLILRNDKRWMSGWLLQAHDFLSGRGLRSTPEVLFVHVPGRSQRAGDYKAVIHSRGRYEFGNMHVTTRFPLGMVQRGRHFSRRSHLMVYPRLGQLSRKWSRKLFRSAELARVPHPRAGIFHDDLHQLREYRAGDDQRSVHWRTSARKNQLMVSEYHESRDRDLTLILDCWSPHRDTPAAQENFERGLRYAVTICTEFLRTRRASSLAVVLVGLEAARWQGGLEQQSLNQLLDLLTTVSAVPENSLETLLSVFRQESQSGARVELITGRPELIREALGRMTHGEQLADSVRGTSLAELSELYED